MKAVAIVILDAIVWTLLMGFGLALAGAVFPTWMALIGALPALVYLRIRQPMSNREAIHILKMLAVVCLYFFVQDAILSQDAEGGFWLVLAAAATTLFFMGRLKPSGNESEEE